jgi:hypothetical protein
MLRRERQRREEKLEIDTWEIQEVERIILKYILRKKGTSNVCVGLIHLARDEIQWKGLKVRVTAARIPQKANKLWFR